MNNYVCLVDHPDDQLPHDLSVTDLVHKSPFLVTICPPQKIASRSCKAQTALAMGDLSGNHNSELKMVYLK